VLQLRRDGGGGGRCDERRAMAVLCGVVGGRAVAVLQLLWDVCMKLGEGDFSTDDHANLCQAMK
jgi:hypothetical protein